MLRLLVTPRWIGWTLLALAAVVVCAGMAWWQVVRAESPGGSLLNAGYAFQWPLFGLFFAALWWRMLRAEAKALVEVQAERRQKAERREKAEVTPVRAAPAGSPFGPRPVGVAAGAMDGAPSPERARWNAMYAELAAADTAENPNEEIDPR